MKRREYLQSIGTIGAGLLGSGTAVEPAPADTPVSINFFRTTGCPLDRGWQDSIWAFLRDATAYLEARGASAATGGSAYWNERSRLALEDPPTEATIKAALRAKGVETYVGPGNVNVVLTHRGDVENFGGVLSEGGLAAGDGSYVYQNQYPPQVDLAVAPPAQWRYVNLLHELLHTVGDERGHVEHQMGSIERVSDEGTELLRATAMAAPYAMEVNEADTTGWTDCDGGPFHTTPEAWRVEPLAAYSACADEHVRRYFGDDRPGEYTTVKGF